MQNLKYILLTKYPQQSYSKTKQNSNKKTNKAAFLVVYHEVIRMPVIENKDNIFANVPITVSFPNSMGITS